MIYELRTYTVKPGALGDMIKAASTVSRDIRKADTASSKAMVDRDRAPQSGPASLELQRLQRAPRMRAELAKNPRWTSEYVPLIRPLLSVRTFA